ncbi:polysaccharide deacetylase family protein [Bizionia argentinensis JUB59]|uniref:Polysaccharide deacetylase family protein n=1 Tax=Bizionia argentinensis JUB59 TaxID=1046627 RepID=G2ECN2_9FLAO|nr:polysaccharide deacetylase family protein [Bizionia argentinensis]EGV43687.1 polysaccharide deacetylase family protein [Bizionia argentinensis JUB59]
MGIIPVKTPTIIKKLLPDYVWEFSTSKKVLYLTFDDGPTPEITQWTLDILKQFQAKATFFCIGNNIQKYPDIFQAILKSGHRIGNHSHTHIKGWRTSIKNYVSDVSKAQIIIDSELKKCEVENINLNASLLFRPPYGQIKPRQGKALRALDYKIITWSILSFDWEKETDPEDSYFNVINKAEPGSIIVFHDSVKASRNLQYALPKVLAYFSDKGYQFKTLPI